MGSAGLLQPQRRGRCWEIWEVQRTGSVLFWAGWVGLGTPPGDRALDGAGPVRRVWPWWGLCISGLGSSQVWGTFSLHSFVPSFFPPIRGHQGRGRCWGHSGICLWVAGGVSGNTQWHPWGSVGALERGITQHWGGGLGRLLGGGDVQAEPRAVIQVTSCGTVFQAKGTACADPHP